MFRFPNRLSELCRCFLNTFITPAKQTPSTLRIGLHNQRQLLRTLLTSSVLWLFYWPAGATEQPRDSVRHIPPQRAWYQTIQFRGYSQLRYNRLLETNPDLRCEQCDRSWGRGGGLFLRCGRMIFSGDVHDRVFIYLQLDVASSPVGNQLHYAQVRDAYFDVALDPEKEFRLRVGQSKVPFGYENMQSSQNRLPLDRADALNSTVPNERDMGVFFYWAPKRVRQMCRELITRPAKGSGDYGVLAFGVYNGQTASRPELNDKLHLVARLSYPFEWGRQIIEPGIQAHKGRFVVPAELISEGVATNPGNEYNDDRVAASLVVQPRPLGILAEYTIGRGPQFMASEMAICTTALRGGQVTLSYGHL